MTGTTLRQATAVSIEGRGMLIEGSPGAGKTSLALTLIDRGAMLIGDDGVTLDVQNGRLHASPPPNTEGLIEIRNVGIAALPVTDAPVCLVLALTVDAPRYVEQAEIIDIEGHAIPRLQFDPRLSPAATRVHWAMRIHGLP
ncbi:serine kinase [Altererythrobacter luteolus]|uniref:Serine kinase n=1 Tax=Pontixanthobacter luteolus TaxID=295089 RepID=A0A6I4V1H8_9SPHN|nr:serine kinase [Pontixanthobacter luteolus]MXP47131.1 serine kinase [Pontixanthobacter luteolus]